MAQSGIALSLEQAVDIISMYSSSARSILAVAAAPGWEVVGTFPMPATADLRLDLIGSVSDLSLTMTALLYCVTPGFVGEVANSRAALSSTIDTETFSQKVTLTGGRLYQVWAQVVGNAGDDYFGQVRRAAPAGF